MQPVLYSTEHHEINSRSYQDGYATCRNCVPKANSLPVVQLDGDGTSCTISNSRNFFLIMMNLGRLCICLSEMLLSQLQSDLKRANSRYT